MTVLTPEQEALVQQEAFDQGTKVAQIFSGIFFSGLAAWLSISNGTKLSFVQRAALEKRLTTCCFISIYVSCFSAFFNFFQLTEIQRLVLPVQGFTLDLARPVEWVMTCPLMQLSLVLMGGSKIPEYRRYMMPGFSVLILSLGTTAALVQILALRICAYALGCVAFVAMAYFNRLQILEYSNGVEGLLSGDSEFRKATLLLLSTWSPFPTWFVLSPEGFGFIENVLVIQIGWAFLNILAKFSMIFYVQRVKDLYCNRLKTKRELGASSTGKHVPGSGRHGSVSPPDFEFPKGMGMEYLDAQAYEQAEAERKKDKLAAVVVETMSFLGMAQHTERFLSLLDRADLTKVEDVEVLTKEQCAALSLPFDLVSALQKRLRVWKLEMVDDAEVGLEAGEEHYLKKILDMPRMEAEAQEPQHLPNMMPNMMPNGMMPNGLPGMPLQQQQQQHSVMVAPQMMHQQVMHGQYQEEHLSVHSSHMHPMGADTPVPNFEDILQKTEAKILEALPSRVQNHEKSFQVLLEKLQGEMGAMEKRLAHQLAQQMDGLCKTSEQRGELRAFENRLNVKMDDVAKSQEQRHELHNFEKRLQQQLDQQLSLLATKVEVCCQKTEAVSQKVDGVGQRVDLCGQRVEACSQSQLVHQEEHARALVEKLEAAGGQNRCGLELLLQRAEAGQAAQAKLAAEVESSVQQRLNELENSMVVREDEVESTHKKRYEELLRLSAAKRLDDLALQLRHLGEQGESSSQAASNNLVAELQSVANRLSMKAESQQAATQRALAESEASAKQGMEALSLAVQQVVQEWQRGAAQFAQRTEKALETAQQSTAQLAQRAEKAVEALDAGLQKRLEAVQESQNGTLQLASRSDKAVEALGTALAQRFQKVEEVAAQAVAEGIQKTGSQAAQRAEKAVESLDYALRGRLDEAVMKAAAQGVSEGAAHAAQRVEKVLEALEASQRGELQGAVSSLSERIEDVQAGSLRKAGEREERAARRLEELLELTTARSIQKVEDVGIDLKKELHGFAKRLNSKIPFM